MTTDARRRAEDAADTRCPQFDDCVQDEGVPKEIARLRDGVRVLREALTSWKVCLAYVGHPQEPSDWSEPIRLTDKALAHIEAMEEEKG